MLDKIFLTGLRTKAKIGIFDWERKIKQSVLIDMEFPTNIRKAAKTDNIDEAHDYKKMAKHIIAYVEKSEFFLVETLAERLAQSLLKKFPIQEITLRVSKPGAIRGSQDVGVQLTRKKRAR